MSRIRRLATLGAQGVGLTLAGFVIGGASGLRALPDFLHPPTNEETLRRAVTSAAERPAALAAEDRISASRVAQAERRIPGNVESRPHLKVHPAHARRSLTGGALNGEGRTTVVPVVWTRDTTEAGTETGTLTSVWHIGDSVCGHRGIVHGGYLATMLDEGLARCCITLLPYHVAMTAELRVDYLQPVPSDGFVVLRARTTRVAGRKAWVEGRIESLEAPGDDGTAAEPRVFARATALFVSPKSAGVGFCLFSWHCWKHGARGLANIGCRGIGNGEALSCRLEIESPYRFKCLSISTMPATDVLHANGGELGASSRRPGHPLLGSSRHPNVLLHERSVVSTGATTVGFAPVASHCHSVVTLDSHLLCRSFRYASRTGLRIGFVADDVLRVRAQAILQDVILLSMIASCTIKLCPVERAMLARQKWKIFGSVHMI